MENPREAVNIQNDFFNRARKDRARVTVFLINGKKLVGRIRAFDRFTVILDGGSGEQMIFKHAIASVAPTRSFENRMDLKGVRGEEPRRGAGGADDAPEPAGD
jgi:host factor-I protein